MTSFDDFDPFADLVLDDSFIRQLPGDAETRNSSRQVEKACYSRVQTCAASNPQLLAYSQPAAQLLNISNEGTQSPQFLQVFAGNQLVKGMAPYATCYGGHQFGHWAGQLGDGRAINLGDVVIPGEATNPQRWTLQLKGAGPTPYSRHADGFAVLRSSVREFLCSEAMYHLGVPTTRALSLITTGDKIVRDMFYDGNAKPELGAVVCRLAPSFTRFGSFEIFAARGETETLQKLVNYTIVHDFPHLGEPCKESYIQLFREICERTLLMIVHWMRVGFVHGVMNTDNMSILGLTIDYGPYGWLDNFDPSWTPNTTDAGERRYRYENQPQIALWNLAQLARALYPLVEQAEPFQEILATLPTRYEDQWQSMMAQKLGLQKIKSRADTDLLAELSNILQLTEVDMTIFYRQLATINIPCKDMKISGDNLLDPLLPAYYFPQLVVGEIRARTNSWLRAYLKRVQQENVTNDQRRLMMNRVNPKYVLRNYMAQLAIEKSEQGDHSLLNELQMVLQNPYDEQPAHAIYANKRPDWARNRPGCSMLSCSS